MSRLVRLPALLLALNWLVLSGAFAWTCRVQGNVLWWLRLDWTGWLGEFSAMSDLEMLPSGSVWLVWLSVSAAWTLAALLVSRARTAGAATSITTLATAETARRQLEGVSDMMQSRPELKDKILKLHQSLDKL